LIKLTRNSAYFINRNYGLPACIDGSRKLAAKDLIFSILSVDLGVNNIKPEQNPLNSL